MLRGPEEVSIINVLMWVSAVCSARGGWCRATCLDWNKLTPSCVYIMDGNGRKRRTLSCSFICPLHRFPSIDLLHSGLREEVATAEVNQTDYYPYPPGRQYIYSYLHIDFRADIGNFIDSFRWCNEGALGKLGHPLDSQTHQPEHEVACRNSLNPATQPAYKILPLVSH